MPPPPPPAGPPPPAARYPLFADDASTRSAPAVETTRVGPPGHLAERRRSWLLPLAGLLALVIVAVVGVVLLVGGDDGGDPPTAQDPASSDATGATDATDATDSGGPTPDPDDSGASGSESPAATEDIAGLVASVDVPGSAPASTDARDGSRVTFGAGNLTDGDPETAWRVAGDASGEVLTIVFEEPVELREVGLVNGYAKSYPGYDGYASNRLVLEVRWIFDDGSVHEQLLEESRSMQMVPIETRTTEQVQLEIVEVSSPGRGAGGRDFTAISELGLGGAQAG